MTQRYEEYDFSEPWPMYADEEKPWTDFDRLETLREKMGTQAEIGDALGCHPSTISDWLQKLDAKKEQEARETESPCELCSDDCPGKNDACGDCLSALRARDYEADYDHYPTYLEETLA